MVSLSARAVGSRRGLVTATSPRPIKRFYKEVTVGPTDTPADLGVGHALVQTWQVFLDGKPIKTPRRSLLQLPTRQTAEAVAAEWRGQGEMLKPREMPLTTVGCTTVDLVRPETAECVDRMLPYLTMDTVCFEDDNEILAARQEAEWGPLRGWFGSRFGVQLGVARAAECALLGPPHPDGLQDRVAEALHMERDAWELCALEIATSTAKSLVVATALMDREDVDAERAHKLALLEEFYQIERWGLVEGEHDVQHAEALVWFEALRRFSVQGRVREVGDAKSDPE